MTSPETDATRPQRRALLLGALLDAAFAVPMLAAPEPAARLLRLPLPDDLTWFRLTAVLLLIVAGCYEVAAHAEPATVRSVALVAGLGRGLGSAVLIPQGLAAGRVTLLVVGVVDGLLGVVHLILWARDRRARVPNQG